MKKTGCLLFLLLAVGAYGLVLTLPHIAAHSEAADYSEMCEYHTQADLPSVSEVLTPSGKNWNFDLRSCDLSKLDLSAYPSNLADYADFDSKTRWPEKAKMPKGFSPKKVLKQGRNPGLGVRSLHRRGIDGRGVGMAIIDQNLLETHQEYTEQLKFYERQKGVNYTKADMHGAAVASIAVGKTVGVAPKVDLFYISAKFGNKDGVFNAAPIAQALERVYELNTFLPAERKIRVVSISRGFGSDDLGAAEFNAAREKLEQSGVAVISTGDLFTISRAGALADADDNASYTRGAYWWSEKRLPNYAQMEDVLFPTDFRVTAAPNGDADYVSYSTGGMSWAVPYAAGLYALAAQVYPDLTPELFWRTARETAVSAEVKRNGKTYPARYLVQPVKLIEKLENLAK